MEIVGLNCRGNYSRWLGENQFLARTVVADQPDASHDEDARNTDQPTKLLGLAARVAPGICAATISRSAGSAWWRQA